MSRFENLVDNYDRHIGSPWQQTVAGAQRVIMIVYDKDLERTIRARSEEFGNRTRNHGLSWTKVDITDAFSDWLANDDYLEAYLESPEDLQLKMDAEFAPFVARKIKAALKSSAEPEKSVVGVIGAASLYGLCRVSNVLRLVEPEILGRLVVFFPGQLAGNNYRLLDAQDGWNYLAIPITAHSNGGVL